LIDKEGIRAMTASWNATERDYPQDKCIHQIIKQKASETPEAIALAFRDQQLSFGDLDRRASIVAANLQSLGAKPDQLIGVFIDRSIEMVIALIAIHKAGAAYVPLDPSYPRDRVALMVEDSRSEIILTHSKLKNELPTNTASVVCVDELLSSPGHETLSLIEQARPNNLAYVIYTSGSTGKPKGVMVEHRNVLNFFTGMDDTLQFNGEPGVWLAVTSISFDISVLEIFWALSRGFKVVIQEEDERGVSAESQLMSRVPGTLDIGLFYFSSDAGPDASGDRYRLLLEGAKFGDENGFSSVWTPERHFHLFGGLYPNPSVTSAAVAAVTKNIAIRAGSIVMPLHNPLRVAEEWSVVDNLSNGRVGFSFASGWHANDFALKPENFENRRQLMFDGIETVRKLWRGESIEVLNGEGKPFEAKIYPPSIQKEPPVWITVSSNIDGFRSAGESGHNILTNLLGQTIEELTEKIAAYNEGWKAKGHEGKGNVSVMVHTFVGADVDEVREIVREPFSNYLKTSFDLVKIAPWAFPAFKQPSKSAAQDVSFDPDSLTDEDMDALIAHAFERYFETAGIFGTPTSVLPLVDSLKRAGATEIACLVDFGVETDVVLDNLKYLKQLQEVSNLNEASAGQGYSIASQIETHGVTHFQCTPSMARILTSDEDNAAALSGLQKVLLGGEALPLDLAQTINQTLKGDLINVYGPTETTIWSTSGTVDKNSNEVTIGKPIANTKVYVLDESLKPVPLGTSGELLIGGHGVVRGYFDRPELTAEKFIANPLSDASDPRVYRTGDLVRCKDNGDIEYMGRLDHQVKLRGYRIELGEIEAAINQEFDVKESVVVVPDSEDGAQILTAYVVPQSSSSSESTGHWQTIWDEAYQGNTAVDADTPMTKTESDATFDVSGWLDSYTGRQHLVEHMQEWVNTTVDRILELKPKRVLEIGCGTGLLLYRVAPECEAYVGVDFSPAALSQIESQSKLMGLDNVSLIESSADALDVSALDDFDVVVINSVSQYFPSGSYLSKVLQLASDALSPSGAIFIGDVRSLPLKDQFHVSLEVAKAPATLPFSELKSRVQERHDNESELVIDPGFFNVIAQNIPAIAAVDIQLKRGSYRTEMSAYRYDVVLRKGENEKVVDGSDFIVLPAPDSIDDMRSAIEAQNGNVVFKNVLNARLVSDTVAHGLLMGSAALESVADFRNELARQIKNMPGGISPEEVYSLDTQYDVAVVWAGSGLADRFDVYVYQIDEEGCLQLPPQTSERSIAKLCFEPKVQNANYEMKARLTQKLRDRLPEFMVPEEFVMLEKMPLTPNGKIDRKALPKPEKRQRTGQEDFVAPANETEQEIAQVFQEMLNLEKIGTNDNFFSLGANSLLIAQANNRLNQRLDQKVSLVAMYRFPTIAKLVEHLSGSSDEKKSTASGVDRAEKRKAAAAKRRKTRTR